MKTTRFPPQALEFKFTGASGPGGQHVNKTATAVELRVTVTALGLPPDTLRRLRLQQRNRINKDGTLIVFVEQHRSQLKNREEALTRLEAIVAQATIRPKRRIATQPTRGSQKRRVDTKKQRGKTKLQRKKPTFDA